MFHSNTQMYVTDVDKVQLNKSNQHASENRPSCLHLIQGSPPPLIPLSAVSRQSSLHSLPVLPPSDCWRLRFSITADFVHLTNYYIIIIIIIIIIK